MHGKNIVTIGKIKAEAFRGKHSKKLLMSLDKTIFKWSQMRGNTLSRDCHLYSVVIILTLSVLSYIMYAL